MTSFDSASPTDQAHSDHPFGVGGGFDRRIFFRGMGALGVAVALAGCGAGGGDSSGSSSSSGGSSSPTAAAGDALVKTSEVPVGGGVILTDKKIVITQPTAGTFKGFTAVCTHQGFTVTSVEDDTIKCNHHGSEFSAADGSVKEGPASAALSTVAVKVDGENVVAA